MGIDFNKIKGPIFGGTSGSDVIFLEAEGVHRAKAYAGDDFVRGTDDADAMMGQMGCDLLVGGGGNDLMDGGLDDDALVGGAGNDEMCGGSGDDVLAGNDGNDTIKGNNGVDLLFGGSGNDRMEGGAGDDGLFGGDDQDKLLGGAGHDLLLGQDGKDTIKGQTGDDSISGGKGNDVLHGGSGRDVIAGNEDDDVIKGQKGDDLLLGGSGDDGVYGGDGDDVMDGGAGDDFMRGQRNDDLMWGGSGDDNVKGGSGDDSIDGGIGNDRLVGNDNEDCIDGGEGDDRIWGDNDDRQAAVGPASDRIDGGAGNDTVFGGEDGDHIFGGIGNDDLYGQDGDDTIDGGDGDDMLAGGNGNDHLRGSSGDNNVFGGSGDDLIEAGEGDDYVQGNGGNDKIRGGAEEDLIMGGSGDDYIEGNDDNDELHGGTGNDMLFGNGDDDGVRRFDFESGTWVRHTNDSAGYRDTPNGDGYRDTSTDREAEFGGLFGGAHDDILVGGAGNDYLNGGKHYDMLFADEGNDVLEGGADGDDFVMGFCLDGEEKLTFGDNLVLDFDDDNDDRAVFHTAFQGHLTAEIDGDDVIITADRDDNHMNGVDGRVKFLGLVNELDGLKAFADGAEFGDPDGLLDFLTVDFDDFGDRIGNKGIIWFEKKDVYTMRFSVDRPETGWEGEYDIPIPEFCPDDKKIGDTLWKTTGLEMTEKYLDQDVNANLVDGKICVNLAGEGEPIDARDDEYTEDEDTCITGNVLDNDTSVLVNETLIAPTVSEVNGVAADVGMPVQLDNGILTLNADGSFEFVPTTSFVGQQTFEYTAFDGICGYDTATVTINVEEVPGITVDLEDGLAIDPDTLTLATDDGMVSNVTRGPDGTVTFNLCVEVPDLPERADIVLAQDLSGSFFNDLPALQSGNFVQDLFTDLSMAGATDVGFGIASFVDYPIANPAGGDPFGIPGDYPYNTDLPITTLAAAADAALAGLTTLAGGDGPEAQLIALQQIALRSAELAFRMGTQKFVVLSTDAPFHQEGDHPAGGDNDNDTDLGDGTGAMSFEDYPAIADVAAALVAGGVTPIFTVTAGEVATYQGLLDALNAIDPSIGGSVQTISNDSSDLAAAIIAGLSEATTPVDLVISSDDFGFVSGVVPPSYSFGDVSGPMKVTFEVSLTAPPDYTDDVIMLEVPGFGSVELDLVFGPEDVDGTVGRDTLSGNGNANTINGFERADVIDGEGGDDILIGGTGNDTLTGGSGVDTFVLEDADKFRGTDTITDYEDGTDILCLSGYSGLSFGDLVIADNGGNAEISVLDGKPDEVIAILEGIAAADLDMGDFNFL